MEIFAHRLKWLRERASLSQQFIAEKLGISQTYYSKFESGKGQPNLETLVKLPDIFGESLDFLLGLTDLDSNGTKMYYELLNQRGDIRSIERTLAEDIELLDTLEEISEDRRISSILRRKRRITEKRALYQNKLNELVQYLNMVPDVDLEKLDTDYWDDYLEQHVKKLHQAPS